MEPNKKTPVGNELAVYKRKVSKRLEELTRVLARVSIGDFSQNLSIPEEEDEFTELFVGVQLMLEVIRENLDQLQHLNDALSENIQAMERVNETIEREKVIDEAILESIGEGMIVTNTKERIVIVNAQAEQMLGMKMKDIIGKKWSQLITMMDEKGKVIPKSDNIVRSVLNTRRKIAYTFLSVKTEQVSDLTVAVTASPIVLGKDQLGVVVVLRDMEEEKEIDRTKTEVVSFTSHQLRTPLSVINWYSEAMLAQHSGPLNPKQLDYMNAIQFTTHRMIDLVNTFLSVSRIQLGTLVVHEEDINLEELISLELKEMSSDPHMQSLEVVSEINPELQRIKADTKLARVVFQNLIQNAVKYTPEGGRILIRAENYDCNLGTKYVEGSSCVIVTISDTGYGIPKKEQSKVFTKLYRSKTAQEIDTEGTGLGLYMVKMIVNYLGGDIWFDSTINEGTTFYVALPLESKKQKEKKDKIKDKRRKV